MKQDDWGPWNGPGQGTNQYSPQGGGYPPPPGGYPPGGGYPGYKPPGNGMAIASMVMGILSLVFWLVVLGYVIFAPLGIIFGIVAKKQGYPGGMATAGLVMSIISIATGALYWVVCVCFFAAMTSPALWL